MGEPIKHVLPGGYIADWFDDAFEGNQKFFAQLILQEQEKRKDPSATLGTKFLHLNVEAQLWGAVVVHGVAGGVAQTYLDVLRFGDGVILERSLAGVGKDALRLLNVIPLVGQVAKVGQFSRLLAVSQVAGSCECTWVAASNAANAAGRYGSMLAKIKVMLKSSTRLKIFVSSEELAKASGVALRDIRAFGTTTDVLHEGVNIHDLFDGLKKMGIAFEKVKPTSTQLSFLEDLIKANPRGAAVVHIEGVRGTTPFGHSIMAQVARDGKVLFYDSEPAIGAAKTAKVFTGIKELESAYSQAGATQLRVPLNFPIISIPNSVLIPIIESAPLLANLFLPVVPGIKAAQPVQAAR